MDTHITNNPAVAAQTIREGGLAAFATETVYGLGANANDGKAVARIYEAKGRPSFNPLIAHVPDAAAAMALGQFNQTARKLAGAFWPGALTLVVPRMPNCPVSPLASAGLDSLAIRVPSHPVAREMLKLAEVPVVAPSANRSGHISPTRPDHVVQSLGDRIDVILEGGECEVGLESTIVSCLADEPVLLRPGAITAEQLSDVLNDQIMQLTKDAALPVAPGQLASHYAPNARVRLNATSFSESDAVLTFGAHDPEGVHAVRHLSRKGDLVEAAANLFAMLHELDALVPAQIAVMPIPDEGIGRAINDRLTRAAAPRPQSSRA